MTPTLYEYKNQEDFIADSADVIEDQINLSVQQKGSAKVVLSGGKSPQAVYRELAKRDLPWEKIEFFLADERQVPFDSPHSNYRMVRETLLAHTSKAVLHFFDTSLEPRESAESYEKELRGSGTPPFDLVVLGLGNDGHTASLFPGIPALDEEKKLALPTPAQNYKIKQRLSLTFPALLDSEKVIFLIQGEGKKETVKKWLEEDIPVSGMPAKKMLEHANVEAYLCY